MHSSTLLVALSLSLSLSFSLSLAAASSSHNSHRHIRSLPRSPRRLDTHHKQQQHQQQRKRDSNTGLAYIKCDSRYSFSLCDDNHNCTPMGNVAAGTACLDGAITWDNGSPPSASTQASTSSDSTSISATATQKVVLAASPTTSSSTPTSTDSGDEGECDTETESAAPTATATATATSDSSDDDEYECVDDDSDSDDSSSSSIQDQPTTSSPSPTPTPTVVAAAVQKTTTSTQQATTTSSSSSSSSNTNNNGLPAIVEGPFTGGKATFYNQYGVAGACGKVNSDDALIVALQIDRYGSGSNNAPDCGRTVVVTNTANGKSVVATVADACPGCENENSLDLSIGAFGKIGDYDTGVLSISWYFAS